MKPTEADLAKAREAREKIVWAVDCNCDSAFCEHWDAEAEKVLAEIIAAQREAERERIKAELVKLGPDTRLDDHRVLAAIRGTK